MKLIVGISGGSGAIYGIALLEALKRLGVETHLVVSSMGEYVVKHECEIELSELIGMASFYYDNMDLAAAISSGSFKTDGMVIIPCSMKTLSSVANGFSDNLLSRAADVIIKERRKLVIVARETPLSSIHLENMLKLSKIGVTIMPPSPGFYNNPQGISDIVSGIVGRVIDQFGIENEIAKRWS